jgi:hypothetical protein
LEILASLTRERLKIERRLKDVETSLRSILALHDDDEVTPYIEQLDNIIQPEGFTDAIRKVLKASTEALTPAEVKDRLPEAGFSLEGYSNPLASIHTILKRLARTENVEQAVKEEKAAYKWKSFRIARPSDRANAMFTLGDMSAMEKALLDHRPKRKK